MNTSINALGDVLKNYNIPVFVINLDRRPDRWEKISKHLIENGVTSFHRISAIDGKLEADELCRRVILQKNEAASDKPNNRQKGVIGCMKSHLKTLELAHNILVERGIDKALILEDDCFFIKNSAEILSEGLKELPKNWQFLMLGAIYNQAPGYIKNLRKIVRVWNANTTHAYIVNIKSSMLAIKRIKAMLTSKSIHPVDALYAKFQVTDKSYALHPLIAGQSTNDFSDIEEVQRFHSESSFKLGMTINRKTWLWMSLRPYIASTIERIKEVKAKLLF